MGKNEGLLGSHSIKIDKIYSESHPPVILNSKLKEGHRKVVTGSILTIADDGSLDVISASSTLQIAGVSLENIEETDTQSYVSYLSHGVVKEDSLKGVDGSPFTEISKLKTIGIYTV